MSMSSHTKPVILIGMMGSGKTTVGKKLAEKMGVAFIDMDRWIEEAAGKTIPEIFAQEGETAFRDQEAKALETLLSSHIFGVIATGGGAVLREENRARMEQEGRTVWLKASKEKIITRVTEDRQSIRPLLEGDQPEIKIEALLRARNPYYSQASIQIDTDERTPDEITHHILERIHHV